VSGRSRAVCSSSKTVWSPRTIFISIDDVTTAVEKVKELGGQVVNGPMEVPGGDLIAQCLDPQGVLFALHSSVSSS